MMLLAMLFFAVMDAINKHLAQDYAITQILWIRYVFFVVFAAVVAHRAGGIRKTLRTPRPGLQILRSIILIGEMGLFILTLRYLPLADVHAIAAITPLIVTAMSVPVLGERVGIRRWMAVLVGFAGVIIIVRPGFQEIGFANIMVLVAAVSYALYQILTRLASRTDSAETSLFYSALVGCVAATFVGPLYWEWPTAGAWAWLMVAALMGSLAHFSLIAATGMAPPARLQPFTYALMVFATIMGFLVFGQFPDIYTIIGATIVVASGLYTFYRERVRARQVQPN
jgi:drug/metabolite transporter (DMT)-like permease